MGTPPPPIAPAHHTPPSLPPTTPHWRTAHEPQPELTPHTSTWQPLLTHAFHVAAVPRERRRCALRLGGPPLGGSGRRGAADPTGRAGRREADREHLQRLAAGGSTHCAPGPSPDLLCLCPGSASLPLSSGLESSSLLPYLPQELQELGIGSTDVSELVLNARRAADARPPDGDDDDA